MSARAERVFVPTLRDLDRDLIVPMPERLRILRELECDLEGLCSQLEAEGMASDAARARAIEMLVPDHATLRDLGQLHLPAYARLTRGLRGDRLRLIERAALALTAGTVLAIEAAVLLEADLLRAPSSFLWLVLGLGALLCVAVVRKAFGLWVRRDQPAPEQGLAPILVLAAAIVATGFGGAFVELYQLVAGFEADATETSALALDWVVRACGLLAVALLLAMAGALAWFLMAHWIALVTGARHELLGIDSATHTTTR